MTRVSGPWPLQLVSVKKCPQVRAAHGGCECGAPHACVPRLPGHRRGRKGPAHKAVCRRRGVDPKEANKEAAHCNALAKVINDALCQHPEWASKIMPDGKPLSEDLKAWEQWAYDWLKARATAGLPGPPTTSADGPKAAYVTAALLRKLQTLGTRDHPTVAS